MTNIQLTEEFLQGIYTVAVSGEIAEKNKEPMSAFDLLCAADAAGGIAHLVRKLIDELRADRAVLQERRKADSEPVGTLSVRAMSYNGKKIGTQFGFVHSDAAMKIAEGDYPLYLHAQPAPERDQVRREHAEWSQATFGDVGPIGPLKHLSKEALEAAEEPGDLSEWADMQFLMWDAQRRAGITDEQITQAMIEKLAVNKQRSWPEPKEGEPRLHIKEQPAPVVPEIDRQAIADKVYGKCCRIPGATFYNAAEFAIDEVEAWQAAMLAAAPQLPDNDHATVPVKWIPVSERMPVEFEAVIAFDGDQVYGEAVYRSGDGFTIDGYDPCDRVQLQSVTHWMPLPAAPQEVR